MKNRTSLLLALLSLAFVLTNTSGTAWALVYQGLTNTSLGSATLSVSSNQLTVSNIGTNGQDGVSIATPAANMLQSAWLNLDPSNALPVGAYVQNRIIGSAGTITNGVLGSMTFTKMGTSNYVATMDFTSIGATSATVQVYNGNTLVGQATGQTGPLFEVAALPDGGGSDGDSLDPCTCTVACSGPTTCPDIGPGSFACCVVIHGYSSWNNVQSVTFSGGQLTNFANQVVVIPEGGPIHGQVSAQQFLAANIPSITITNERISAIDAGLALVYQGLTNTALGVATLSLSNSQLAVSNIGTSGQDGVSIATPAANMLQSAWLNLDPSNALPVGAYVQNRIIGSAGTVTNGVLGSTTFTKMGTSNYVATMDFTSIGATSATVQVYNGNTLVGQATGQTGPLFEVAALPDGGGSDGDSLDPCTCTVACSGPTTCPDIGPGSFACCVVIHGYSSWNNVQSVTFSGGQLTNFANQVVVIPEGGPIHGQVSAQQFLVANIPSITITNEIISQPVQFSISSITVVNSNGLLITWTTLPPVPPITNIVQVTTNRTGNYNPSNFVDLATVIVSNVVATTNAYLDTGAVTNRPTRYYRIREPLP